MNKLDEFKALVSKATVAPWSGSVNTPFYGVLEKPAPSLSKHDHTRPHYWREHDVRFVLRARNGGMEWLIKRVEELSDALCDISRQADIPQETKEKIWKELIKDIPEPERPCSEHYPNFEKGCFICDFKKEAQVKRAKGEQK